MGSMVGHRYINDAARLAEQHTYINSALDFAIHPTIYGALRPVQRDIRIADVSPGSQFSDGPGNPYARIPFTHHQVQHITQDQVTASTGIDSKLQGAFDVVAVRLLHAAVKPTEWDSVIQNLVALLRPGGWIQWVDWDPLTARIAGVKAGAPDAAIRALFHRFTDSMKENKIGTTYKIPTSFRTAGLEEDDSDMYTLNPEVAFTRNIAVGAINTLRDFGTLQEEELKSIEAEVEEEIQVGNPLLWYDLWCHLAKKLGSLSQSV